MWTVIGREDCHLCHDMEQDLRVLQHSMTFEFEVREIDEQAVWLEQWSHYIPVLLDEQSQLFCYGRLDKERFLKALQSIAER